jgi:hypothetical protein
MTKTYRGAVYVFALAGVACSGSPADSPGKGGGGGPPPGPDAQALVAPVHSAKPVAKKTAPVPIKPSPVLIENSSSPDPNAAANVLLSPSPLTLPSPSATPTPPPTPTPTASASLVPSPSPTPTHTPTPSPTPSPTTADLVCPSATAEPGGITTCFPVGTVFSTGRIAVTINAGGVFTPGKVFLRPGSTIIFTNVDTKPHSFIGLGSANTDSGTIAPGKTYTKIWTHLGTWTFRDGLTAGGPIFTAVDVPR